MVQKMFAIFDEKAQAYLQPFFLPTDAVAIRAVTDCVNDPNHNFGKYPADYTLFSLGSFDDTDASFTTEKTPIGNLIEYKTQMFVNDDKQTTLKLVEETD